MNDKIEESMERSTGEFLQLIGKTVLSPAFHSLDRGQLDKISKELTESVRASRSFGRSSSQVSSKLLSLTMLDSGPYRMLRQCLAQIEAKRLAVKSAAAKLEDLKIKLEEVNLHSREYQFATSEISDQMLYIEGALKEIGIFQDAYKQIQKNNDIPDNWDEKDFEDSEIEHHIRTVFKQGLRDLISSSRVSPGTIEYFEQLGIHPVSALKYIRDYLNATESFIQNNEDKLPSIDSWYEFLDKMVSVFKPEHKKAMKRIGLDTLINTDFVFKDRNRRSSQET